MPNSVRWTLLFVMLLSLSTAFSQQPAAEPAKSTTFVSHSQLVLVPVIVHDASGHHIPGLKKGAFRLDENGKPQAIKIFEEVATEKMTPIAAPAPGTKVAEEDKSKGFSNLVVADAESHRVTIIVLDMLNTPAQNQVRARTELIKYLSKTVDSNEPVTLLGLSGSGLHQLHSFTTDPRLLIAELNKLKNGLSTQEIHDTGTTAAVQSSPFEMGGSDPDAEELESFLQDSIDNMQAFYDTDAARKTLLALNQIATAYSGIPGRKALVWATSGFPFMIDDPQAFAYMGMDMVEDYERTWRTLMTANIAVYPVDVVGLVGIDMARADVNKPPVAPGLAISKQSGKGKESRAMDYDRHAEQKDTMREFAGATGGTPCLNSNDLAKCFQQAVDDSRTYYLVGFYLGPEDRKPGWRKLKVHVEANGAHVRAREGFYVGTPPKEDEATRKAAMVSALSSPIEFTGIAMNVKWTSQAKIKTISKGGASDEKISAGFMISLPPHSFTINGQEGDNVDLLFSAMAFDRKGNSVAEFSERTQGHFTPEMIQRLDHQDFTYRKTMHFPVGTTVVRFVVRDNNSGDMGSVNARFEP